MRWRLDDNERGAFNYLFGGVVLVVVVRLLVHAIGLFGAAPSVEEEGLAAFQHGYFLSGSGLQVVATAAGRMERVTFAVLIAVALAMVLAAVAAGAALAMGQRPRKAALFTGRAVLLVAMAWGVWSALFVPVERLEATAHGLVVRHYRAVRDIPVPFTATCDTLRLDHVERIEAVLAPPDHGCNGRLVLQRVDANGAVTVLSTRTGLCTQDQVEALRQGSGIAAALERSMH